MGEREWAWFPRQPTVAQKRARARAAAARLTKSSKRGDALDPVVIEGSKIAATFWGKAWCRNLESYSDFANRLPRGRSYLRAGAVVDLKIASGKVRARVAGSRLYEVEISIRAVAPDAWRSIIAACGGRIDSMVALLKGRVPDEVMRVVTEPERGLFPQVRQIAMTCSCPDWAGMCKHVAAALYGVGARLDSRPELLFVLRGVDAADLVHAAADELGAGPEAQADTGLAGQDLGALFGIELTEPTTPPPRAARRAAPKDKARSNTARPKATPPKAASRSDRAPSASRPRRPTARGVGRRGRPQASPVEEFLTQLARLGEILGAPRTNSRVRKAAR